MNLKSIARQILFAILDAVLPAVMEQLGGLEDLAREYAREKASKILEKQEIINELRDAEDFLGALVKKIF